MEDWKNGMVYALGGAALFLAGGIFKDLLDELDEDDEDTESNESNEGNEGEDVEKLSEKNSEAAGKSSLNGLNGIVDIVRREAEAALAECKTDEERQAVYAKIEMAVQELQASLTEKGTAIAEAVKEKEAARENADGIDHVANIYQATREAGNALDDMLAFLNRRCACNAD